MYNADGSFVQPETEQSDEVFNGCKGKSIDEIYEEGRAFNFLASKPSTITLSGNEMPD